MGKISWGKKQLDQRKAPNTKTTNKPIILNDQRIIKLMLLATKQIIIDIFPCILPSHSVCLSRCSSIAHQIARPPLSATHQYPACCLLPEGQTNTCCWQALPSLLCLPLYCLSEAQVLWGDTWKRSVVDGVWESPLWESGMLYSVKLAQGSSSTLVLLPWFTFLVMV